MDCAREGFVLPPLPPLDGEALRWLFMLVFLRVN